MKPEDKKTISHTKSVCPQCLTILKAQVIEQDGKVYLEKECPRHGCFKVNISNCSWYYRGLKEFHSAVMDRFLPQHRFGINLTAACDMNCPICYFTEAEGLGEITIAEIEQLARRKKNAEIIIYGMEPTCRNDLPEVIQRVKKYRKQVSLYTNGLRLKDKAYLNKLKQAGLDRILFQFDGFRRESYHCLRGGDWLEDKLAALENIREENIPVELCAVIAKDVNEDQINKILEYAVGNPFIQGISYIEYIRLRRDKDYIAESDRMLPDDLITEVEKQSKARISRRDLFCFQKLLFTYMSLVKKRVCLQSNTYWLVRKNRSYLTAADFIDLAKAEKVVDRYKLIYRKRSKIFARAYLLLSLGALFLFSKSWQLLWEWLRAGGRFSKNRRFLSVKYSRCCDPFNFDYQIVSHCGMGAVWKMKPDKIYVKNQFAISVYYKLWKKLAAIN